MGGSSDLSLKVILRAQDSASGALKGFGSTLVNLAGAGGPLLKVLLAISAAVIGFGAASVQMAAQYQTQMNMVQALTGSNTQQMAYYDAQVKQLAINAGVAPAKLASGLYNVLSASYSGAQAMQVLTLATEDSKIGLTSAATTTDALTKVLRAFNVPAKDFVAVNGEMLRTVTAGQMSIQQYAGAVAKSASVAVQYKDSMSDMNAVLATLTSSGIKNAAIASTDYNNLLKVLNGNTAAVAKAAEKLNPAFNSNAFAAMNVHDKVMYLNKMIVAHGHNISEVIGKQQNAAAAFTALATHASTYGTNLKNLSDRQANANATASAWATTQSGFNQQLSRAQAAVSVLMIDIGQKLLPVLTKIVGAVAPAVQWLISFASAIMHNKTALAIIGGVLVGFVALILMLVLPAMWAWIGVQYAAAVATLAWAWPFLLAAAIIAAVVALIIIAIQHWGQIVSWLKGVWAGIVAWFQGLWNRVKLIFWLTVAILQQFWQKVQSDLQGAWNAIVGIVQAGLQWLWNAFTAPFRAIGQLFVWLYNHNYYFKKLIDTIRVIIAFGVAWLKHAWQTAINWLVGLWAKISGWASSSWNKLKNTIIVAVLAVAVWLYGQWTKVSGWLTDKWNQFSGLAKKAWQAVSGVFSSIWSTYIAGPLGSLWNQLSSWFSNLAKTALQWGQNLITGFINGIKNMLGQVAQTAQNVASTVAKFLGFHSPAKEGEGRFIVQWGSNMLKGFGSGVLQAIPALQAQVAMAVHTGLQPMSPPALSSAIPYGRPPSGNTYNNSSAGGYTHNGDIVIQGYNKSPQQLAQEINNARDFKLRRSGSLGNPARGGRNS